MDVKYAIGRRIRRINDDDDPLIASLGLRMPSLLSQNSLFQILSQVSDFLAVVDKEVNRILGLHPFPHVALLLDLSGKSSEHAAGFFSSCDMRSPRLYADMLDHLGYSPIFNLHGQAS